LDLSLADEGIDVFRHVYTDRSAAAEVRGQCTLLCFPRIVTLEVTYYQITKEVKRILKPTMIFAEFDRDTSNAQYTLTIDYYPLNYIDLVIAFAFPTGFFIILFIVIGVITLIAYSLFWLFNRGLAIYRHGVNPPFKLIGYLSLVVPPIFAGMIIPTVPMALITFGIFLLFSGWQYIYGLTWSGQSWVLDVIYNAYVMVKVDTTMVADTRTGRIGLTFLVAGAYMMALGALILVPRKISRRERDLERKRDKREIARNVWTPTMWRRMHLILLSIFYCWFLMIIVELSFWNQYGTYIYEMIVMFKILNILCDIALEASLREAMLVSPLSITMSIVQGLVTLGAADFLDFVTGYAIDLAITMFESLYIGPLLDTVVVGVVDYIASTRVWIVKKVSRSKKLSLAQELEKEEAEAEAARRAAEAVKLSGQAPGEGAGGKSLLQRIKEEADAKKAAKKKSGVRKSGARKRRIKQEGEESGAVEDILGSMQGYGVGAVAVVHSILLIYILIMFREEVGIPDAYNIQATDMSFYLYFSIVMLPFQFTSDMFIHSAYESFWNFKMYEYLVYARYRFLKRETRWKGMERHLDECIEEGQRTLDQMCFSSQFYFTIYIHSQGMFFFIMGLVIITHVSYNFFGDPALPILLPLILVVCYVVQRFSLMLANAVGLWQLPDKGTGWHSNLGDGADANFGIPDAAEIENLKRIAAAASAEHYIMNQKITQDTFRYKFLDYNRLWLVDKLPQIFTPRTLRRSRPYLIAQLAKILGVAAPDLDDDDDDEIKDELTEDYGPVKLEPSSKAVLKWWLASARRRLRLRESVAPFIARAKRKACEVCGSPSHLTVELMIPTDALGDRFERDNPNDDEFDVNKWKAFFVKHQRFRTVCGGCIQRRKNRLLKPDAAPAEDDLEAALHAATQGGVPKSSTAGMGDPRYGPVFISPQSKAIAHNWLEKARRRLGVPPEGTRPRVLATAPEDGDAPAYTRRPLQVNAATRALATRWLQLSRFNLSTQGVRVEDLPAISGLDRAAAARQEQLRQQPQQQPEPPAPS